MKRPTYSDAMDWLISEADTSWINDRDIEGNVILPMFAAVIADLFEVEDQKLAADLTKRLKALGR